MKIGTPTEETQNFVNSDPDRSLSAVSINSRETPVRFLGIKPRKIRVAWLASYPSALLHRELTIIRSSKEHPLSWIVNLGNALAKRDDIELHIITATSGIPKNQVVSKDGITFHVIRHTFPFTVRGFPRYMRLDVLTRWTELRRQIRRILLELQPDMIHVHGTEYGYGLAALETKIPTIVSIQGIVKLLAQVAPCFFYNRQAPFESHIIRTAKYFGTRTEWADSFIRSLNKTAVIYDMPEAVNPLFFDTATNLANQNILMVGAVEQRKGIEDALHAMSLVVAACPGAKLLVVGVGTPAYLEHLKLLTKSARIDGNVEWLGSKTAEEIATLHESSAILIHPTHIDNSPNSVAEAMASGLPVIASDVGGLPSMIENGVTGLLTEPRNSSQLAEAIISLLQNGAKRAQLANRAKEVALERHFPSTVAQKTINVYQDMIARTQDQSAK